MFYYYGGKSSVVSRYQRPVHDTIVEPFAGSAMYSVFHLMRRNAERVILVEKDPRVVELWQRLLAMTPDDVLALPIPAVGERTTDFLYMTAATSNAVGKSTTITISERMPYIIGVMLKKIAYALPHVKGRVEVIEGDYRAAPDIEATWFIDPPYQLHLAKGNSTKTALPQGMGYGKGCDSSTINYADLADWAMARRGHVIVVEQEGADWLPFTPMVKTRDSQGDKKREMVWESGGPSGQGDLFMVSS